MTKPASNKNIVLYADDDTDDLDLVQEAFLRFNDTVELIVLKDGSQLLSCLSKLHDEEIAPCLILLDINMPVMNGKEVLKKLKDMEVYASIPVVLFSTSSQPEDIGFARNYSAGFITKPLNKSQMQQVTELFIDHCTEEIQKNIRRHFS